MGTVYILWLYKSYHFYRTIERNTKQHTHDDIRLYNMAMYGLFDSLCCCCCVCVVMVVVVNLLSCQDTDQNKIKRSNQSFSFFVNLFIKTHFKSLLADYVLLMYFIWGLFIWKVFVGLFHKIYLIRYTIYGKGFELMQFIRTSYSRLIVHNNLLRPIYPK